MDKTYYCEQCFHTYARLVTLDTAKTFFSRPLLKGVIDPDELEGGDQYVCPNCLGEWKLNRGQARHIVSLKLQHYRRLAEQLGILEIEEECDPCHPECKI